MIERERAGVIRDRLAGIAEHWADPLYRNGYYLVASSTLSSALGLLFWLLAAQRLDPEAIGLGGAAIAALSFLARLSSFNLVNGLNRFVPRAGYATRRLILVSYTVVAGAGLMAGLIYLVGIDLWSPTLSFLADTPAMAAWFTVAVAAWAVFTVQDGALTGLRASSWVVLENLLFAIAKIVALVFLAGALTDSAVFLAWTVPVLPIVIGTNVLMFARLISAHEESTGQDPEEFSGSAVRRFVTGDYSASLVWMATVNLLPVLVLERAGAEDAAYFYLAWTVAYVLYLVGRNFGMSMLTETATDPRSAPELTYRTLRQTMVLLVPATLILVAIAPLVLFLFGEAYSSEGAAVLRLLALGAVPAVVVTTYAALLRAERRVRALVGVMAAQSVLVLGLAWWLLGTMGITGVGVAWLAGQTAVAVFVLFGDMRPLILNQLPPGALAKLGVVKDGLLGWSGRRSDRALAREILGATSVGPPGGWRPIESLATVTDARATLVGGTAGPEAILKLARSDRGANSLTRSAEVLHELAADARLDEVRETIPTVLDSGAYRGRTYLLEALLPGIAATGLSPADPRLDAVIGDAVAWTRRLAAVTVDHTITPDRWLRSRLGIIEQALRSGEANHLLDQLARLGETALAGLAATPTARVHGDFWLGNLLIDPSTCRLSGVIDWDTSTDHGPADLDLVVLLMTSRVFRSRRDTGKVVVGLVDGTEPWDDFEIEHLAGAQDVDWASSTAAVSAAWLHGAALNMEVSARYQPKSAWFMRNVEVVLGRYSD